MNILVILNSLGIGGAENYTIALMNEFVRLGNIVDLKVLSNNCELADRLDKRINLQIWERKRKLDLSVLMKTRNVIKSRKYDGIIASYIIYQKLATMFLKTLVPTIYPIHSTVPLNKKAAFFNKLVFKFSAKNEVFLTSIDNQTKYLLERYHLKSTFFKQIYNGIDTNKFSLPLSTFDRNLFLESKGINPLNRIILMVAGFRKEKRHIDAIEAFSLLKKEFNQVSIVFVGNNDINSFKYLQSYIESKNIKDVHIFPASTAGNVRYFYWSADLFTLTSNKVETFPISSLEAMATGLPCVLTDTGGAKDIIEEGVNGLISQPNNIVDIKNKWYSVIKDIKLYNNKSIRKKVVEQFDIKIAAKKYIELIEMNVN